MPSLKKIKEHEDKVRKMRTKGHYEAIMVRSKKYYDNTLMRQKVLFLSTKS